jgi:predicted dehydrogenase/threonine dehydrogenase-like Zn-dependent dehydrogenase
MKQVFKTKKQRIIIEDVPEPRLVSGQVLVHNEWSLISAGTETGGMVLSGDLRGQIQLRRDLLGKGVKALRTNTLKALLRKAVHVDNIAGALGYSSAGRVIAVADDIKDLRPGQRVACAGSGIASHAELVAVPRMLVHPVPDDVTLRDAAWTTVGCIALQGIRQGEPRLGEHVLVVGLGLLGLLAVQMLRASGCTVTGVDPVAARRNSADLLGAAATFDPSDAKLPTYLSSVTQGLGADLSLIFAGTSSSQPLNQSMELVRKRGRVVIVGAVGMELKRSPFYQKEIDLRIACSYGPGRYDLRYEQDGVDYPAPFVRWTENRNMGAVLNMIRSGQLQLEPMISSEWDVNKADEAYAALKQDPASQVGVMLHYPDEADHRDTIQVRPVVPVVKDVLRVGIIGAGGFVARTHLPNLHGMKNVEIRAISTRTGMSGKKLAVEFGVPVCTTNPQEILADKEIDAVVIGTRHDSHGELVCDALRAGKHVFVEKPAAITMAELDAIRTVLSGSSAIFTVGYNRRYAPLTERMKRVISHAGHGALQIVYRINAGVIPADNWVQQRMLGGGRLIGEGCHFIDLANFLAGSCASKLTVRALPSVMADAWMMTLEYACGSLAQIQYVTQGGKSLPKERVEVHGRGISLVLDNFAQLQEFTSNTQPKEWKQDDKGHAAEMREFVAALRQQPNSLPGIDECLHATESAILAQDWLDGSHQEDES